jgi:hypothetical protein
LYSSLHTYYEDFLTWYNILLYIQQHAIFQKKERREIKLNLNKNKKGKKRKGVVRSHLCCVYINEMKNVEEKIKKNNNVEDQKCKNPQFNAVFM